MKHGGVDHGTGPGTDDAPSAPLRFREAAVAANAAAHRPGNPLRVEQRSLLRTLPKAVGLLVRIVFFVLRLPIDVALRRRRRSIPYVAQVETADCGAAALAMVCAFHGRPRLITELRDLTSTSRDGVNARSLLRAARRCGFVARAVRVELDDVRHLPRASILHWNLDHFVVLDHAGRRNVTIVDPALGRRELRKPQLDRSFTGVALLFEPTIEPTAEGEGHRAGGWRRLLPLLARQRHWPAILGLSLVVQATSLAVPFVTRLFIDRIVPNQEYSLLRSISIGLGIAMAAYFVLVVVRGLALVYVQARIDVGLVSSLLGHLVKLPYRFFETRSVGDLLLRVRSTTHVRDAFAETTVSAVLDGLLVAVYLVAMVVLDPKLGLILGGFAVLQVVVLFATWSSFVSVAAENIEAQARSYGYLVQAITGMETLKASGAEDRALETWTNLFVDEVNTGMRRSELELSAQAFLSTLRLAAPAAILVVGTYDVLAGSETIGTVLAAFAVSASLLAPLGNLVKTSLQLSTIRGYLHRFDDIFDSATEQSLAGARMLPSFGGSIEARGVSFRYGKEADLVLRDVDVSVPAGATIGLVGSSGSGKSTLAKLLAGLELPESGTIAFDGVDVRELDVAALRTSIGTVTQQSFIFAGSIRQNITLGDEEVGLDAVITVAKEAGIHQEIKAMPMAYDTIVSDGGATISGGQRQRIGLARAFLRSPALLVLDEATSAVDSLLEQQILDRLAARQCTKILVAHRLSTVRDADMILVLDRGRIIERGTHAQLMACHGRYAALVKVQGREGGARG
jgi:ATP-binding cassette subfamily B protein